MSNPTSPVLVTRPRATSFSAMNFATPLFCIPLDMPKAPAMVTMTSHLMALRASCCVSVPDPIITAARARRR